MKKKIRKRRTVYCQLDFLKDFLSMRPLDITPSTESIRANYCWLSMFKFIWKSELVLDISEGQWKSECTKNKWMYWLWKSQTGGQAFLRFAGNGFPNLENLDLTDDTELNAIYLTVFPKGRCMGFSARYGIVVMNAEMAMNCEHLFKDNGTAFPLPGKRWDFIQPLIGAAPPIRNCNAMVIVDSYLFLNNYDKDRAAIVRSYEDKVKYNLIPILNEILPLCLTTEEPFQIFVFTGECPADERRKDLIDRIKEIRKGLSFEVTFFNCGHKFHDRTIFTNNLWIACGRGFDVFGEDDVEPRKFRSTNVNLIFPSFQTELEWADGSFENMMEDISDILTSIKYNKGYYGYAGAPKVNMNRICSYYLHETSRTFDKSPAMTISETTKNKDMQVGGIDLTPLPLRKIIKINKKGYGHRR